MTDFNAARAATLKDMETYGRCANEHCRRKVGYGTAYCCGTCTSADADRWELEEDAPEGTHPLLRHTDGCETRRGERGLWDKLWIDIVRPARDGRYGRLA